MSQMAAPTIDPSAGLGGMSGPGGGAAVSAGTSAAAGGIAFALDLRPDRPGYVTPADTLKQLRERRRLRQMYRDLDGGQYRRVLIQAAKTQHRFRGLGNAKGQISELLVKVNVFRLAVQMHATILVGRSPEIEVPQTNAEQAAAVEAIRRRCLLDATLTEAAAQMQIAGESPLRIDVHPEMGVYIVLDDPDRTIPVGPIGPDRQPTVWERRWIVERAAGHRTERFLRVERHRAAFMRGIVEQEAYRTDSVDTLVALEDLERVSLDSALGAGHGLAELAETGLTHPPIVRLAAAYRDGWPAFLLPEDELDILDAAAAALSRLSRAMELHASPKVRVPDNAVDQNGRVDLTRDAYIDPDKQFEYISLAADFAAMTEVLDRMIALQMLTLQVSPALLGVRIGGGATPDSYEKVRLESTGTMTRAWHAAGFCSPALSRLLTDASIIESRMPGRGFAVAPVTATYQPELPKDEVQRGREIAELRDLRLYGELSALVLMHGRARGEAIFRELMEDRQTAAQLASAQFGGSIGLGADPQGGDPQGEPDDSAESGTGTGTGEGGAA